MNLQADPISALAGIVLSLIFAYAPGAKQWFGKLDGTGKRLVMLGLCLLVVLAQFGLACGGLGKDFGLSVTCDRAGIVSLVWAFVSAVIANQATFLVAPRRK